MHDFETSLVSPGQIKIHMHLETFLEKDELLQNMSSLIV